jgi:hypothetical protein
MRIHLIIAGKIKRRIAKRRTKYLKAAILSLSDGQKNALRIYEYLINNKDTDLVYSVISDRYYMEYKNIIFKICDSNIVITNGVYWYDLQFPDIIIASIKQRFLKNLESRKRILDRKCESKLKSSMETVYKEMISS